MTKKMIISSCTMMPEVMTMPEDRPAYLDNLPTTVRGFCYHDNDGEPYVVLNARLTREQNRKTWKHERKHIDNGEMFNEDYHEYEGR